MNQLIPQLIFIIKGTSPQLLIPIIFEVTVAVEGGYDAKALGHSIFTQGEDWEDLKAMVRDAVRCHFNEDTLPDVVRLHLIRDEAIAV